MKKNTIETFFDFGNFLPTLLITDSKESKENFMSFLQLKAYSAIDFYEANKLERNIIRKIQYKESSGYKNCFIHINSLSQSNVDILLSAGLDMIFLKTEDSKLLLFQEDIIWKCSDSRPLISCYFLKHDLEDNECVCIKNGCKYPIITSFEI